MKYLSRFFAFFLLFMACKTPQNSVQNGIMPNTIAAILDYPHTTKWVKIAENTHIAYADTGKNKGTPLVFIHGLGSNMRAWDKNIAELSGQYRCIRLDLAGYGKSGKGKYQGGMSYYAAHIKAFCSALGLKKVILVGHSMGGQIALTAANAYPELVEKIVLIAPAGFETFGDVQKTTLKNFTKPETIKATSEAQIKRNIAINFVKMPEDANFMVSDRLKMNGASDFDDYCYGVAQNVYGMLDEPIFDKLNTISAKTLCIFGKNDALIPNKYLNPNLDTEGVAKSGTKQLKNARLELIEESGHFVMWEKAAIVNQKIKAFLTE